MPKAASPITPKTVTSVTAQRSISVQLDTSTADTRVEELLGHEYLVVPVVAMVEGVRFGANQDQPELGLAVEFGSQPILWANRPLVMNHPQVDGVYVSANSPLILAEYFIGLTMNPIVDGPKLKMEAWIDVARVEELGGDAQEILDRIEAGDVIEVSVGFFSDLEPRKGKFNGQVYGAVWRNIRPDHLAILSVGSIGACSIKDGCGMPRINANSDSNASAGTTIAAGAVPPVLLASAAVTAENIGDGSIKPQCSCGGAGDEEANNVSVNETDDRIEVVINKTPKKTSVPAVKAEVTPEQEAALHRQRTQVLVDQYLSVQKIDSEIISGDVSKLINRALRLKYGSDVYLYGFTNDMAVFEVYDFELGYTMKQIEVSVTADKVVFKGEPKDVILLTRIVPQESNMPNDPKKTQVQEGANPEAGEVTANAASPEANKGTTTTTANGAPKPAVSVSDEVTAQITQAAPKELSVQEYIAQAPEGMRDVLSASLKVHEDKKEAAIKTLKDSKQCKFSDEFLKTQTLEVLENMVGLLPGTYNGVATPANPTVHAGNSNETVPAPKVFGKKPTTAAA